MTKDLRTTFRPLTEGDGVNDPDVWFRCWPSTRFPLFIVPVSWKAIVFGIVCNVIIFATFVTGGMTGVDGRVILVAVALEVAGGFAFAFRHMD